MDRGAWWAIVHRVAESQTQLKQVSLQVQAEIGFYTCKWFLKK